VVEDAGRLRDALGVDLPPDVPAALGAPVADPVTDLLTRFARGHGPFTVADAATWLGWGTEKCLPALRRLQERGRLVVGALRPEDCGGTGSEYCDAEVLEVLRRRSLAVLREQIAPVPLESVARFWPTWHHLSRPGRGPSALLRAVGQLAGSPQPMSMWESLILPARVRDYTPAMLDELVAGGEVFWSGHGALPRSDGWVALHPAGPDGPTDLAPGSPIEITELHSLVLDTLATGGAQFFRNLSEATGKPDEDTLIRVLWDLVWSGRVTNDTVAVLRHHLAGGSRPGRTGSAAPRSRRSSYRGPSRPRPHRPLLSPARGPGLTSGRWSLLPPTPTDPTRRLHTLAERLIDRYGLLSRATVAAEDVPGGYPALSRVLTAMEEAGHLRRGYFVTGLGGSQFAHPEAVELLRDRTTATAAEPSGPALVLTATDPANPYGATVPWPERAPTTQDGSSPRGAGNRRAGALVVLLDGELVLHLDRGYRSVSTWTTSPTVLGTAARALAELVHRGSLASLTLHQVDGVPLLRTSHPLVHALTHAGFHATPRGFRIR
jgi:ATP-dependent Lhr-like helicase